MTDGKKEQRGRNSEKWFKGILEHKSEKGNYVDGSLTTEAYLMVINWMVLKMCWQ